MRIKAGAQVRVAAIQVFVARSSAEVIKPKCRSSVSRPEERNAKEKRSKAWVMHNPPLLKGRDESRT